MDYWKRIWLAWKEYEQVHGETLSQVQLAKRVSAITGRKLDHSGVSKMKKGKRRITLQEMEAIALVLGKRPEVLAGWVTEQGVPVEPES